MKLKEEEQRAVRYLETRKGCDSVSVVSYLQILSTAYMLFGHLTLQDKSTSYQLLAPCWRVQERGEGGITCTGIHCF